MTYTAPPYDVAERLMQEIWGFLKECGGHYGEQDYLPEHLLLAIATGQFLYKRDAYFVCWWNLDAGGLREVERHIRPADVRYGPSVYVVECGCRDRRSIPEIRRRLRVLSKDKTGIHWHRAGKGWQHFPRQKGGHHG